jgi:hypothetical protein
MDAPVPFFATTGNRFQIFAGDQMPALLPFPHRASVIHYQLPPACNAVY